MCMDLTFMYKVLHFLSLLTMLVLSSSSIASLFTRWKNLFLWFATFLCHFTTGCTGYIYEVNFFWSDKDHPSYFQCSV